MLDPAEAIDDVVRHKATIHLDSVGIYLSLPPEDFDRCEDLLGSQMDIRFFLWKGKIIYRGYLEDDNE